MPQFLDISSAGCWSNDESVAVAITLHRPEGATADGKVDYCVLYRWFVGLSMDDPIWLPATFSKNRERLLQSDIAAVFFDAVIAQARTAGLLSDEHFTVDGTLAWRRMSE